MRLHPRTIFLALGIVAVLGGAAAANLKPVTLRGQGQNDRVLALVELWQKPTAVVYGERYKALGKASASTAAVSHLGVVKTEQASFRSALAKSGIPGLREVYRLQRTFNGIAYATSRSQLAALRALPGVKAVHIVPPMTLDNARSVPFIGTPQIWTSLGLDLHGENIKVGIIDTGIDYIHADFGGSGDAADYAANDPTIVEAGTFPTAKVVGGWDFAGADYDAADPTKDVPTPDEDPFDATSVGHGTHVAGTVAGLGVNSDGTTYAGTYDADTPFDTLSIGPGVAPGADLYALKVFGDGEGSTGLAAEAVEWALDPDGDGDFSDRLDVVNLSLGSPFGSSLYPDSVIYTNAVQTGLVIVASAGNSEDYYFITGSPGCIPEVISVAASMHDGNLAPRLQVNAPAGLAGYMVAGGAAFGPGLTPAVTGDVVIADPLNGCAAPFNNATDIAGKIALIHRGQCPFVDKVTNAEAAGAIGVVMVNNAAGDPIIMGGEGTISIPSLMISDVDGAAIEAAINNSEIVNVTLREIAQPEAADNIAYFSSRGPSRVLNQAILKPDVSAPGWDIISASAGTGTEGISYAGTSMASPHIAGVMALLRQYHPTWSPAELKALLMNTAGHDVYLNETDDPRPRINPARVGAGRVDVPAATASAVIAYDADAPERVSVTFATLDVVGAVSEARTVQLRNLDTIAVTYDVSLDLVTEMEGVSIDLQDTTVDVPADGTVDFTVTLNADASQMLRRHDATVAESVGGLPRYWLAEETGYLVFTPQGGGSTLRVPLYAALHPASDMAAAGPLATTDVTGSGTLDLTGQGVASTEPAPVGPVSVVTPFELLYASPNGPPLQLDDLGDLPPDYDLANTDLADLKYFGATSDYVAQGGDLTGTTLFFAIVTHGLWGTPAEVLHEIDFKRSSADDVEWALLNYPLGDDQFATYLYTVSTGSFQALDFLNGMWPGDLYLPVYLSDAMVLPVPVGALGLTDGDADLEMTVYTTLGGSDVIDASATLHYNVERPGFSFNTSATGVPMQLDADGQTVDVEYDLDAARANASGAILLLHHLNGAGKRGEMVPVEGLTCTSNTDCDTPEQPICDPLGGVCVGCVDNGDCRGGEICDVFGSRICYADCRIPGTNPCPAGNYCDQGSGACIADCRWQGAEPCGAGSYCSAESGLCVVANALVTTTPLDPGDANCPAGGVRIDSGIDDNGDLVLDPDEIDSTSYVCNGMSTLVNVTDEPAGDNCAAGGKLIETGIDDNADGVLDSGEVDESWYVCNGPDGHDSLVIVTDEPAGDNCPEGGKKIETGIDDNADGVLDTDEVDDTSYVCQGTTGLQALTNVTDEPAGDNCPAGGKKVETGIDDNADGVLDADEVDQTSYVCNGVDGSTGADGYSTLVETTALEVGSEECPRGGLLVTTGTDLNGNGVLEATEVESSQAVCNGKNGSGGCSVASSPVAGNATLALLLLLGLIAVRRRG